MLLNSEIEEIKRQVKEELTLQFRRQISEEVTGASGRVLKKILRILSLNIGIELKPPKDTEK